MAQYPQNEAYSGLEVRYPQAPQAQPPDNLGPVEPRPALKGTATGVGEKEPVAGA